MSRRTGFAMVAILAMITLVATACGPAPTPEVIKETVVVEKEVEKEVEVTKEVEVEKEVVVTATPEPEAEAETILIGGFGPLSAPGSYQSGTEMRMAAEMAVDEVNDAGGVLGKQVELIFGDTEGLPERGTAVTERLITQNNVVGLVGEYHSGVGITEKEVAHKYHVPVVFAEPWADEITASGYPEVFRLAPSIEYYSRIATNYIAEAGWESVVWIVEDSDYGHLQGPAWTEQLEELGITDVEVIYADPATEDYTPILQRIQQDPPDLLSGTITGVGNTRILRQACELGLVPNAEVAYASSVDAQFPEFWEGVGECGKHVWFTFVGLPKSLWNEKTTAFVENFKERYDRDPSTSAMAAYDSTYLLLEAIKQAGSTDPDAIIEALENIEYTGVMGELWFEYGSDNPVPEDEPAWKWHQWLTPNVYIVQYTEQGQPIEEANIVYPRERATGPLYTAPPEDWQPSPP